MTESAPTELSSLDLLHLERARSLARKGWGMVQPNPLVGCVLVRDGEVVGEGYHEVFGGPHAEIVALEAARSRAAGATAYVSLEPCNHHGKTPPCSEALVQAGVQRVVYGAADPTTQAQGGAARLREAGIDVLGPAWMDDEAWDENPAFFHCARHEAPFVALKLAMTLDGFIARRGEATRITGVDAQREVHRLRRGFDGILVGSQTVKTDDPNLSVRLVPPGLRPPRRLVLDSHATLPSDAAMFEAAAEAPVHVFTRSDVAEARLARLEELGAHVHPVPQGPGGLDLGAVMDLCWGMGIHSILCEGGGELGGSLLRQGLAQQIHLFVAPRAMGAGGVPAFPTDGGPLPLDDFQPAGTPRYLGRDAHLVFNRRRHD